MEDRSDPPFVDPISYRAPNEALVVLAQLVVAGADSCRLTRETARATALSLRADRCEILRPTPDGEWLLRVASCDEDTVQDEPGAVPCGVSSAAGYALLCGAPILSRDIREERHFGAAGVPRWEGPVSAVVAPVPDGGAFGALAAYAGRAGAFDARDALSIGRTASLLGAALERVKEREELRRRAWEADRRLEPSTESPTDATPRRDHGLTARQLEVLGLMADGRPAKQIASELSLSIHTVHSHQRNLYRALGVGSLAGAIKRAGELGLPEPLPDGSDHF